MNLIRELRRDHQHVRLKLARLEEWAPHAHAAPFTLSNALGALSRLLERHALHTQALLGGLPERVAAEHKTLRQQVMDEHKRQAELLASIQQLIGQPPQRPRPELIKQIGELIEEWRARLVFEEAAIWPGLLEGAQERAAAAAEPAPAHEPLPRRTGVLL